MVTRRIEDEINRNPSLMDIHDPYVVLISRRRAAFSILLAALAGALGFWIGQYALQSRSLHYPSWLEEQKISFQSDRYHFRTFMYNGTFASTPSEETNMAWDSLFPGKLLTRYIGTAIQMLKNLQKEWVSSKTRQVIRKVLGYQHFISFIVS